MNSHFWELCFRGIAVMQTNPSMESDEERITAQSLSFVLCKTLWRNEYNSVYGFVYSGEIGLVGQI